MEDNQAQVDFKCGDFNNQQSYWTLPQSSDVTASLCLEKACPDSVWTSTENQEHELHILSVGRPRPSRIVEGERQRGYYVDVDLLVQSKPITLVLVSKSMVQWNLKVNHKATTGVRGLASSEVSGQAAKITKILQPVSNEPGVVNSNLKEIIVVGPDLVWLEGVPQSTKVSYFSKDQLCVYPDAWEEVSNPENQYRRLLRALHQYTHLQPTSFQGKKVAHHFKVPFQGSSRGLNHSEKFIGRSLSSSASDSQNRLNLGLQWERQGKALKSTGYRYLKAGRVESLMVPENTQDAFFEVATNKIFIIKKHQFGSWDPARKKFQPIHLPLKWPAMYWPQALTFNPLTSELLIYNDDRGGEVFAYNVVTGRWRLLSKQVGYSLVSLVFDSDKEVLFGTRYQGKKLSHLVKIDKNGTKLSELSFSKPIDFAKNRWNARLVRGKKEVWLKVVHPADPRGEVYPLSQFGLQL